MGDVVSKESRASGADDENHPARLRRG